MCTYCFVFPRVTILSSSRWFPWMKSPRVRPSSSFATLDWRVERARLEGAAGEVEVDASVDADATDGAGDDAGDEAEGDEVDDVVAIARESDRGRVCQLEGREQLGKRWGGRIGQLHFSTRDTNAHGGHSRI